MCEKKANNLKITNVALVAMSQGFPRITAGYHKSQMSNCFRLAQLNFESILASDLKDRFFVQILVESFIF